MTGPRWTAALLLLVLGCADPEPSREEVVARFEGTRLSFRELEAAAQSRRGRFSGRSLDELVAGYRRVAEDAALQERLRRDTDMVAEIEQRWALDLAILERRSAARAYLRIRGLSAATPSEEELESHYEEHREAYHKPARRLAFHLFRRQRPGESRADVLRFLEELRRRAEAGERFRLLAREYSDSENRRLDGRLGWVEPGGLPADLEEVIFELEEGEVSQPLPVTGGAVLVYVHLGLPARDPTLEDLRPTILEAVRNRQANEQVEELVQDLDLGEGIVVPPRPDLGSTLATLSADDVLLETPALKLTVGDFLRLLAERQASQSTGSGREAEDSERQAEAQLLYDELRRLQLLGELLAFEGFPANERESAALEAARQQLEVPFLDGKLLAGAMDLEVLASPEKLREFFEANRARFQSPLRLRLRTLSLPIPADPDQLAASWDELRRLYRRSLTETVDLQEAARRLGGDLTEATWLDFAALSSLPEKARVFILALEQPGLAEPFSLDRRLFLMELLERQEPEPLSFSKAQDTARAAYLLRHGQELFRELKTEWLEEMDFTFDEEAVRRRLLLEDGPDP